MWVRTDVKAALGKMGYHSNWRFIMVLKRHAKAMADPDETG